MTHATKTHISDLFSQNIEIGNKTHHKENTMSELDLIKKECADMVETLQQLNKEETDLRKENEILSQQAVMAGSRGEIEKKRKNKKLAPVPDAVKKVVVNAAETGDSK